MMSISTLMKLMVFLIVISLVATSLVMTTTTDVVGSVTTGANSSAGIFQMIGTFYKIVTFQIPEIPLMINLIVFEPIAIAMIYVIVNILKDLVPFT